MRIQPKQPFEHTPPRMEAPTVFIKAKAAPHQRGSSPLAQARTQVTEHLNQEQELRSWQERLDSGYLPNDRELLHIQRLVYGTTQRVELASRLIASVLKTLEQLKQTPL